MVQSLFFPLISLSLFLPFLNAQLLSPYIVHESRTRIPEGWSKLRKHNPSALLPLRFGLAQPNIEKLEDYLMDISHPDSPNYGDHWSPSKVAQTFSPSDETVNTVREWLISNDLTSERVKVSSARSWINVNVTVEEAERLLHTKYHVYQHESGSEHVACEAYHLPSHIVPHVDLITPTIHFDAVLVKRGAPWRGVGAPGTGIFPKTTGQVSDPFTDLANCDKQTTPNCLRALYGVPPYVPRADNNSYGIVEYTPQAYLQSDLQLFAQKYASDLIGKSPRLVSIDGGIPQTMDQSFGTNGESNLDLQYGMALVGGQQPVTLYQVGDTIAGASFNNFLDALDGEYCNFEGGDDHSVDPTYPDNAPGGYKSRDCGTVKPANVISTSYGYNEAELSHFYIARQCAEYAKLGLMGVTVVYSSGDNGVAGNGDTCLNPDGAESTTGKIFNPTFPSTCPFVTSVGATQVKQGGKVTDPETACETVIRSGGGFSNYFPIPGYQRGAVGGYLKAYPPKGFGPDVWNSTGRSRAYPDISANGANYVVAVDGTFSLVYGTSASAPVIGAILTLVNDVRISFKKKPIGFINPAIYSEHFKYAFHDISNGTNPGCGTSGFASTKGWDPVTGLGTPDFAAMVAAWLTI